jgi:preprotein translocase subunit YajC
MFISEALAQTSGGAATGGGFSIDSLQQFLPIVLIMVVFYFLMLRPQQKKMKALREMVSNLRRGDRVLLQGGIYGKIANVPAANEAELMVEIADKVQIKVVRSAIAEVLEKSQPVAASDDKADRANKAE